MNPNKLSLGFFVQSLMIRSSLANATTETDNANRAINAYLMRFGSVGSQ